MTTLREAAQQALEALEVAMTPLAKDRQEVLRAITALRAALAEPVQEPVAWQERQAKRMRDGIVTEWTDWYPCQYRTADKARAEVCDQIPYEWRPLYAAPLQRKPLTEDEIVEAVREADLDWQAGWTLDEHEPNRFTTFARAIERAHGIGEQQ